MRKALDSTSANTKFRRQSLRLNAKELFEQGNEKRKSSGAFACNQTRKKHPRPEQRIVRLQRERERGGEGKEHIQDHGVVCVFTSTRKPIPPRKKTIPAKSRERKKEIQPKSDKIEFFYKEGLSGVKHPSLFFSFSIVILECFQHRLAFGNEC